MSSRREFIQLGLAASALAASPVVVAGVKLYARKAVATMPFFPKTEIGDTDLDALAGSFLFSAAALPANPGRPRCVCGTIWNRRSLPALSGNFVGSALGSGA
jgi:hypothetical protein